MKLQEAQEYKNWVLADSGKLVLERAIEQPIAGYPAAIISIVKKGSLYNVYRTFWAGGEDAAVSQDYSGASAETVFEALLEKYSQPRN